MRTKYKNIRTKNESGASIAEFALFTAAVSITILAVGPLMQQSFKSLEDSHYIAFESNTNYPPALINYSITQN